MFSYFFTDPINFGIISNSIMVWIATDNFEIFKSSIFRGGARFIWRIRINANCLRKNKQKRRRKPGPAQVLRLHIEATDGVSRSVAKGIERRLGHNRVRCTVIASQTQRWNCSACWVTSASAAQSEALRQA